MSDVQTRYKKHLSDINSSQNKKRPLYDAIKKYGEDNFFITTLEVCNEEEIDEREQFWINKLNTYSNGYNATRGGDGNTQYDYDAIWTKYKELQNIQQTANYFGCDRRVVRKVIGKRGVYNKPNTTSIPIYQLDKDTLEIIKQYPSIKAAAAALHGTRSAIELAINNIQHTAYNFRWCKVEDYATLQKPKKRIIQQIDSKTGKIIAEYSNYTEAALKIGKNANGGGNIRRACMGKSQSSYGYKWKEFFK